MNLTWTSRSQECQLRGPGTAHSSAWLTQQIYAYFFLLLLLKQPDGAMAMRLGAPVRSVIAPTSPCIAARLHHLLLTFSSKAPPNTLASAHTYTSLFGHHDHAVAWGLWQRRG